MRPFHEVKKDKKAQRERGWKKKGRNRAPSCQREADLIAKRRRKKQSQPGMHQEGTVVTAAD